MATFKSYVEAKIAHPDQDIYLDESVFRVWRYDQIKSGTKCNPADYCITVEKFLDDGHKFVEGDIYLEDGGSVVTVKMHSICIDSQPVSGGDKRFILRAAALEEKPKRVKVEYVKVDGSIEGIAKSVIDGDVFYSVDGLDEFEWEHCSFKRNGSTLSGLNGFDFYRRVETEIDERQEFIDAAFIIAKECDTEEDSEWMGKLYDSGKFKLVNAD